MSSSSAPALELLERATLANRPLANRAVMAPMTRSRALGNVPNDLMATYYGQRAEAGLIVTEGTAPTPHGLGYPRIPGIFSDAQVQGWKPVTEAVHRRGGRIFLQVMDTGRVSHPDNLPPGAWVRGPSAVPLEQTRIWVDDKGNLPVPAPKAMTGDEIEEALEAFGDAARNAVRAGFDGVEIHGANGYLVEQFLNPHTNRRDDAWGGSVAARVRFLEAVVDRMANAIGADRVGLRLSPYGTFNEMPHYPEIQETYDRIASSMSDRGIAYLHLVRPPLDSDAPEDAVRRMAAAFDGVTIFAGGYDRDSAEEELAAGDAQLIAFGRPFLANPDLLERFERGAPLNEPDPSTFYAAGPEGYIDYPALDEEEVPATR